MKLARLVGAIALAGAATLLGAPAGVASTPSQIAHARFSGVSCVAATFCVAVGAVTSEVRIDNVIEMWNGHSWQRRKAPIPTGGRYGALSAVSCSSRHFCLAVGDWTGGNTEGSLGEVWNGKKWTILRGTKSRGIEANLTSVSCVSVNRCLGVGSYLTKAVGSRPLAEAWNGTTWTITPLPNPDHSSHAKGAAASGLSGVSCTAARKCVAVGTVGNVNKSRPLVERWDGSHWKRLAAVATGTANSHFSSVACVSARRCRAVGNVTAADGATTTLVQVWKGGTWTTQPSVSPARYSNFSEVD